MPRKDFLDTYEAFFFTGFVSKAIIMGVVRALTSKKPAMENPEE